MSETIIVGALPIKDDAPMRGDGGTVFREGVSY